MCQLPVMNPIRSGSNNNNQFDDPSEPIYTDPSLFERSRYVKMINFPLKAYQKHKCYIE